MPDNSINSIDESILDPDKLKQAYEKADTLFGAKNSENKTLKSMPMSHEIGSDSPFGSYKHAIKRVSKNNNKSIINTDVTWLRNTLIILALISCFFVIYYLDEIYLLFN